MLCDFLRNRRGSVSVMAGLAFTGLIAIAGLVVQASQLYVVKLREQRTADLATLAAGNLPSSISAGNPTAAAIETAQHIAQINGFGGANVAVTTVNSGAQLQVMITKSQPTPFRMLTNATATTVVSAAVASPAESSGTCILTLLAEVDVLGNSTLSGTRCNLASQLHLEMDNSRLVFKGVTVGVTQEVQAGRLHGGPTLTPPLGNFVFSKTFPDPMKSDPAIIELDQKLAAMDRGWPYARSSPVNVATVPVNWGTPLVVKNGSATVPQSATVGFLSVTNSTVTFRGSGAPDPGCINPTTIAGVAAFMKGGKLRFNAGCYVFGEELNVVDDGDVVFELIANAQVRFVFNGKISNPSRGNLILPNASYSIAGGIENTGHATIRFGSGEKVIGGTITNADSVLNFGDGPHYLPDTTVLNTNGDIFFGAGPFYFYGTTITNNAAVLGFGRGLATFSRATVTNKCALGNISFAGGGYYVNNSKFVLMDTSDTAFGSGNFEFYGSTLAAKGNTFVITGPDGMVSGTSLFMLVDSHFVHSGGDFTASGVTFATRNVELAFGEGGKGAIYLSAPTGASPKYGYQNLLVYSQENGVYSRAASLGNLVTGVMYVPRGVPLFSAGHYAPRPGGCLSIVSGAVLINGGASVDVAPCPNYNWSGGKSSRSFLRR